MLLTTFPSLWGSTKAVRSWKTQILVLCFCGAPSFRPSVYILSRVLLGLRGHMPPVSSQVLTGALHLYSCVRRLVEFTILHFICMSNAVGYFFFQRTSWCDYRCKCIIVGVLLHIRVTHQALSLKACGISGLTMTVELNNAERDLPPKSDNRAPLMATTGCVEPSKFSAWRKKKKRRRKVSKKVIQETECEAAKAVVLLSLTCLVCVCSLKTPESNIWYGVLS